MNWWLRLWRRRRMESDLERELRFDEESRVADLVARGVDPDDARRQARMTIGGVEQVKEACRDARGTRLVEEFVQDVRYSVRAMYRMPGIVAAALVVLALGIGATTVMFAVINSVLLAPLDYPHPERLVTVHGSSEQAGEFWGFSNPDFQDLRHESRTLLVSAWNFNGGTITDPGDPEYVPGWAISADVFSVLGVPLALGRAFRADEDRVGAEPVAIISYRLWQRRFGGAESAIGGQLTFNGRAYTVVGVAPSEFDARGDTDVYTPLGQTAEPRMQNRRARFLRILARLRDNTSLGAAQAELDVIARRLAAGYPQSNAGADMRIRSLQSDVVGDVGTTLWLLLAAVAVVLVIACVNVASLLLARAASREREFAMRAALGAGLGRLVRQCLTESAVLAAAGGLLGAVTTIASLHRFVMMWPGTLPRATEVHLDARVWLFTAAVSTASSVLFGLAPVLRMRVPSLDRALRAGVRTITGRSHAVHDGLVIAEISLAVVLLVSAGALGRSLLRVSQVDPGVKVDHVLTGRVALSPAAVANPERIRAAWQDVLDRAGQVPGVEASALADIVPMRGGVNPLPYSITATLADADHAPVALATAVTTEFLQTMGISLRRGRFIDERDRAGSEPVVVIDEILAQHAFGGDDPVGKVLWVPSLDRAPVRVIGLVNHVRHFGLAGDDSSRLRDQMYYPFAQVPTRLLPLFSSFMSIVVRTRVQPSTLEEPLRQALRGAANDQALYAVSTMENVAAQTLDRQRFVVVLFGIFAAIAVLLACVGIYGVLAFVARLRVPEFGVRMALGASSHSVLTQVLRHSAVMIGAGVFIGGIGAWVAGRSIERFVDGAKPADLSTVALMSVVLVAAALIASVTPAWRASRVDPLEALRQE
jgi:predicted permease